jgi:hypothetical protein
MGAAADVMVPELDRVDREVGGEVGVRVAVHDGVTVGDGVQEGELVAELDGDDDDEGEVVGELVDDGDGVSDEVGGMVDVGELDCDGVCDGVEESEIVEELDSVDELDGISVDGISVEVGEGVTVDDDVCAMAKTHMASTPRMLAAIRVASLQDYNPQRLTRQTRTLNNHAGFFQPRRRPLAPAAPAAAPPAVSAPAPSSQRLQLSRAKTWTAPTSQ